MAETQGYYVEYRPSLAERFWKRLGFHYHLGEEPTDVDGFEGWSHTTSTLRFSWADRIRLLISGELQTTTISHYNAPSPSIIKNRLDWVITNPALRKEMKDLANG